MIPKGLFSSEFCNVNLCCKYSTGEEFHKMIKDCFRLENWYQNPRKYRQDSWRQTSWQNLGKQHSVYWRSLRKWSSIQKCRSNIPSFPDSNNNALKRLMRMKRKMAHDKEFIKQYNLKVEKYIQKEVCEKVEIIRIYHESKGLVFTTFCCLEC